MSVAFCPFSLSSRITSLILSHFVVEDNNKVFLFGFSRPNTLLGISLPAMCCDCLVSLGAFQNPSCWEARLPKEIFYPKQPNVCVSLKINL